MKNLAQIPAIKGKIKTATKATITALHKLIFEEEGDRGNRQCIRGFPGFDFRDDSEEFRAKLDYTRRLTIGDLISICNLLGLDYAGNAEVLRERIVRALVDINSLQQVAVISDDEDDEEPEDSDVAVNGRETNNNSVQVDIGSNEAAAILHGEQGQVNGNHVNENNTRFTLSYKDVEDSVPSFDVGDSYSVQRWISDFEEAASMFQWNNLQKLIFARRCLKGIAKLFVQSEGVIKSWTELKMALTEEFSMKITSAQLHKMLQERKMKREESIEEYFLAMKELASRGTLEMDALFDYVIDGIQDETHNKMMLFGAKTIREFKEKLRTYEKIRKAYHEKSAKYSKDKSDRPRQKFGGTTRGDGKERTTIPDKQKTETRCFNCGIYGHHSKDCKKKALGKKCFNCNEFGHEAAKCLAPKNYARDSKSSTVNLVTYSQRTEPLKEIFIDNIKMLALIDTGSRVSLIREDMFRKLKGTLVQCARTFLGFGKGESRSLGYFQAIIYIDREDYPMTLYVVPSDAMGIDVVVGRDILEMAVLKFDQNKVIITKTVPTLFIAHIDLPEETKVDLGLIPDNEIRDKVEQLINSYQPNICKSTDIKLSVSLKDGKPISQRPRRLPAPDKKIVEEQVAEWQEKGIIEACSSEYASPVVVAKKKDGSPRVCIDYRPLNKIIEKDKHPLPLIEDQIDKLKDARVFSTLDLKNGFFHVTVDESSRKYTAFVTHEGQYQFLKAPFGLCNSPPAFQRYINHIFRPLINSNIMTLYLDDIIVIASNFAEALANLETVLKTASDYGLELNFKKCRFMKTRIEFLGQIIENGNIYPSPNKIEAVMRFPEPKSVKDVQSFLGLTGYFRKFMRSYSLIAKPLSDLLRGNNVFRFNEDERRAFCALKELLTKEPVLKIFNPDSETELHTDACRNGLGAILLQRSSREESLHPVYYWSRKTTAAESNYRSYELEVLAVMDALKKFRVYLLGLKFKIVTDCAAFAQTMNKKDVSAKIWRWAEQIEDFDYVLEHRPGTRMKHVDAISRSFVMTITEDSLIAKIKKLQEEDPECNAITERIRDKPAGEYSLRGGLIYKFVKGVDLLMIPESMHNEIIQIIHQKAHYSLRRTMDIIQKDYYIPDLKRKIEAFIGSCIPCILANKKEGKAEGFLHPLPKADLPLYTYHVDHLGPLESTSKNYNHIFAVIDSFTKFLWLYPTKSTTSREVIAKLELQKQIFGNPVQIISDRGTAFSSGEFCDYCKEENIKHILITTGLPRANGQIERLNRSIIPILTKLSLENPTKWYQHIPALQNTLNSTYHRSIDMTPFELLVGVKMKSKEDLQLKKLIEEAFREQFQEDREALRLRAKSQILQTQEENCKTYNFRRRVPRKYLVGDLVAIKRTQMTPGRKLRAKYLGPYRVEKAKINDTYDVKRMRSGDGPIMTSTCAEYMKPWS